MSLLLDALKKAADDKQRAAQSSSGKVESVGAEYSADVENTQREIHEEQSLKLEELQLDDELTLDKTVTTARDISVEDIPPARVGGTAGHIQTDKMVVSDEALSLLIKNTNHHVRVARKILGISLLAVSLFVIVAGGIYYYLDLQAEIAIMESSHRMAMSSMRAKINKENVPEKSEIIRQLVSEADLSDKVKYAKKHLSEAPKIRPDNSKDSVNAPRKKVAASGFTIQKTKRADPISSTLEAAWLAYDSRQYSEAKDLYSKVLSIEENNRDALLGIGAIALLQGDSDAVRYAYTSLLKQDPNDAIASAALSGLQSDKSSMNADVDYLLSMLAKNPDAPQLHFAIGNVYAKQEKWKLAQQSYFSAWQADSENADYIFNLAVSLDQMNKSQQALTFYRDSLLKSKDKQVSFSADAVKKRITELSGL